MKPIIICLCPVRNNATVLDRYIRAASLWADYIIICDQMSTDGSREIALKYSKVILVDNPNEEYSEVVRTRLLLNAARKIEGQRLLVTLDADEMFSPEIFTSDSWQKIITSSPGSVFSFQWANFLPDLKRMWLASYLPWAFMDDGSELTSGNIIHNYRIPISDKHVITKISDIKVIHFQYTDWRLMQSKHRWYQCYEVVTIKDKCPLDIYRMYNHMYNFNGKDILPIPQDWINIYNLKGINIKEVIPEKNSWFDKKVLDLFDEYGVGRFAKLYIWDENWRKIAKRNNRANYKIYRDPRKLIDKLVQFYLVLTQPYSHKKWIVKNDKRIKYYLHY